MNNILSIVGLVFTVAFGIPAVVALVRRYPTELVFVQEEITNLHNKVIRNIEGLKITYKGEEISELIYVVRGFLFCRGKDIVREQIRKNLNLSLPENSRWHSYQVVKSSTDLELRLNAAGKDLELQFDLFKDKEYVYFKGLFEASHVKDLGSLISFKHRIANVGSVKRISTSDYRNRLQSSFVAALLGAMLLWMALSAFDFFEIRSNELTPDIIEAEVLTPEVAKNYVQARDRVLAEYHYTQLMLAQRTIEYPLTASTTVSFTLRLSPQVLGVIASLLAILFFVTSSRLAIGYYRYKPLLTVVRQTLQQESVPVSQRSPELELDKLPKQMRF